jgi:glyoxylase-like metal-dependent hydrolase (beta-lactamase superfamily II)
MTKVTNGPIVECFTLGPFMTNCMLVRPDAHSKRAWIADVGFEPDALLDRASEFEVEAIVLTHCHADHIAGVMEARRRLGPVPIIAPAAEVSWLNDPQANLSASLGLNVTAPEPERTLSGGEDIDLCGQSWKVFATPGHSPGSISLYHEPVVIVGDVLFAGSIGRTDFPGSSFEMLAQSIREHLYTLPGETMVYPGHGPTTTIEHECTSNPYVRPVANAK